MSASHGRAYRVSVAPSGPGQWALIVRSVRVPAAVVRLECELDVHLHQCHGAVGAPSWPWHALHPTGLVGNQHVALTGHRAHGADLAIGAPRSAQEPQAHQFLQPLAVLHIAFAPRARTSSAWHRPAKPSARAVRAPRTPGSSEPRGFQCHRVDAAREQPVGHRVQVVGHHAELAYRVIRRMPGHRHPVARSSDVNPRRIGKHNLFISNSHCCHRLLQNSQRTAAPWETSNSTRSLERDAHHCAHQCHRRIPDHAHERARLRSHQCWVGHVGAAVHFVAQIKAASVSRRSARRRQRINVSLCTPAPRKRG